MSVRLCLVIPNYNGVQHLSYSLRNLEPSTEPQTATVLVDDASTDTSVEFVEATYPNVIVLRQSRNSGFAAAVNRGITWAIEHGVPYVAIFNSDIQVPAGFWRPAIEHLDRNNRVGIVGFREVNSGSVELPATVEFSAPLAVLPGMMYICRTTAVAEVGLYDEAFVMYGEESDLFDRLIATGWQLLQSNIPVWHFVSGAREKAKWRIAWYSYRNAIWHAARNRSLLGVLRSVALCVYYAFVPHWPASRTWLGRRLTSIPSVSLVSNAVFQARIQRFNVGNRAVNLAICMAAVVWNVLAFPVTIAARRRYQLLSVKRPLGERSEL
jgi:GT2 family glycosyltransferase